ncbi:Translation initiation factor IF-2 [Penicillium angulare]|uniref:Translation initiation factor IF-2, mitochondrial n=1 Tax=Penicillium angulare TaxID=116970 RepID=A0A9W9JVT0_9EURO|nr:Translation initiation factor IF-2 [Penicillium angulare]
MHRRAVLRLPRRVELCSASAIASTPIFSSQRTFQSSAAHHISEPGDNSSNDGAPKPSAFAPKFGNRWGGSAQRPMGLSPAEQAMRDALVAKSTPPPPLQAPPSERSDNEPHGIRSQRWAKRSHAGSSPRHENKRGIERPRRQHPNTQNATDSPFDKRPLPTQTTEAKPLPKNWVCQKCKRNVFPRFTTCPFCKTPGPNAPPKQPRPSQSDTTSSRKFRELGQSILAESESGTKEKTKKEKPGPKAEKKGADQWSWDMSALDNLEVTEEAQESVPQGSKKLKRRDGGKHRVSESSELDQENRDRRREDRKRSKRAAKKEAEAAPQPLYLPEFISVTNLADVIGVRPGQFIQRMEAMGFEDVEYNHVLDAETAGLVAAEYNYEAIFDTGSDDIRAAPVPEDVSSLPPRPPVVTIMGHVDHGKTTILDWLRKSSVAATEHGGITQHIGAFSVAMPSGKTITFLDTPGHSAFLEMRRRGADVTDIVVLVVASDDSVKPQTIEAIKHATQANVPIIVAISKIDKEGRNPDRVKQDLAVHGVHVEDYGGDVQAIGVSGKSGEGMLELEEAISVQSEMLDHRADTGGNVEGWILEASTKSYGRVASALIRRGTLRPGDVIVAGTTWARVRTLRNEAGLTVDEATPGMPIEIDGWREQPTAGTEILQTEDEQKAKSVVEYRQDRSDTEKLGQDMAAINEARRDLNERRRVEASESDESVNEVAEPTGPKGVNYIIKADVGGSAEAVLNSIAAIGNNEVYANILRSGVGPVTEFDIEHAAAAKGRIISFNMPIEPGMTRMAELEHVTILDHNIIYKLIDHVKEDLSQYLAPTITQRVTGEAEIGQIFEITVKGRQKVSIAGCRVRNGTVNKARQVKVLRGNDVIYTGSITSLKNVKKDVTEMRKDTECGIGFEDWSEFAIGDHIQCYEEIHEKRSL